ncbi:MAG: hypothetical protein V1886_00705 [archaeon]
MRTTEEYFNSYRQVQKGSFRILGNENKEIEEFRTVEIRQQPLFRQYSTLICVERANRPVNFNHSSNLYTKGHIQDVVSKMLQSNMDGINLEKAVENELLKIDQSEEKKKRDKCPFCYPNLEKVTPNPKKMHNSGLTIEDSEFKLAKMPESKVISVPNLYPFTVPHWVTIFAKHKPDLQELNFQDIFNYIESGYEIAKEIKFIEGVDGMWDIINWGPEAAASQPHPHAQRGGIATMMITEMDREIEKCTAAKKYLMDDPFEHYMNRIRQSALFGFENEHILIHAPFAPKFPHSIDIICKRKAGNILDLNEHERKVIAHSMLGVFHLLYNRCGVRDLNVVTHQTRLNSKNESDYHLHWHFMPRNLNKLGGVEINLNNFVVSVFPEATAKEIKTHYKV